EPEREPCILAAHQGLREAQRRARGAQHLVQRERAHRAHAAPGPRLLPPHAHGRPRPRIDGRGEGRMRVCVFNRSYWPDDGATGQLLAQLCEALVVALTDPPIIGLAALYAARRAGARFVYVCQDLFPEVTRLMESFRSRLMDAALERVGRALVARADRIVAVGETMRDRLVEGK